MLKKFIKLLVLCSLVAVFLLPTGNIEIGANNTTKSLIQTMSHGIGGD